MKQQLITIVLGEVNQAVRGEIFQPPLIKSAPVYAAKSMPLQLLIGQETQSVDGHNVVFHLRGYPPDILLVQTTLEVENVFQKEILDLEDKLLRRSRELLRSYGGQYGFAEEYSIFVVSGYTGEPEQFFDHAPVIAALLKSERLDLDPDEVDYTLKSRIKYANNDLTIIDWDGAFVFDPEGDTEEDLELLTLANLQLLRYRILDRQVEERLELMANRVNMPAARLLRSQNKELMDDLREIVKSRMSSISELQRLERDIKLIGDWYSARFYDLATDKFKIDQWRQSIRNKLDSLEDIYAIVVENFTVSGKHRAEWIQIIAFFFLQIGWFVLIILEIYHFTR